MLQSAIRAVNDRLYITLLHKFSTLFAVLYVILFLSDLPYPVAIYYLLLSVIISTGVAGLGYIVNDFTDTAVDRSTQKANMFLHLKKWQIALLFVVCILFIVLPWHYLYFDYLSLFLLCSEVFLFILYSFRPFRLKERGIIGLAVDALYAHVIPCLLAAYTFMHFGKYFSLSYWGVLLFILWLFLMGVRNILVHQVLDYENDRRSGTITLATTYGLEQLEKVMMHFLFPLEFLIFLTMLIWLLPVPYGIIPMIYLAYCFAYMYRRRKKNYFRYYLYPKQPITPELVKFYNGNLLNEFYEIYLPILILAAFTIIKFEFIVILAFHLLVFYKLYLNNLRSGR